MLLEEKKDSSFQRFPPVNAREVVGPFKVRRGKQDIENERGACEILSPIGRRFRNKAAINIS